MILSNCTMAKIAVLGGVDPKPLVTLFRNPNRFGKKQTGLINKLKLALGVPVKPEAKPIFLTDAIKDALKSPLKDSYIAKTASMNIETIRQSAFEDEMQKIAFSTGAAINVMRDTMNRNKGLVNMSKSMIGNIEKKISETPGNARSIIKQNIESLQKIRKNTRKK